MKAAQDIIIKPIITEHSMEALAAGKYTFKVAKNANKTAIKLAVQEIYNIKPVAVNTVNVHPKMRRVGRYSGMTNAYKKAIVTLPEGTSINFYNED